MASRPRTPLPGDTRQPEDTRMQRTRLQTEAEEAQARRTGELTMITAKDAADTAQGVWDGQSGELIEGGLSPADEVALEQEAFPGGPDDRIIEADEALSTARRSTMVRTDGPADMRIGPLGIPIPADGTDNGRDDIVVAVPDNTPRPGQLLERADPVSRTRVIRVNEDLDPTIGQGAQSQWHFKKGHRYRVPEPVALHLHEKGYVSSWG